MTTKQKDGGAAFPNSHPLKLASGMTLRQWYAGMALQGILATNQKWDDVAVETVSAWAREAADTMIAELDATE